ncbi:ribosomal protein S18-alanine N-acetyltransferase [Corynebacterium flavescens]|uniref:ribosomal protein S18-alanine N-acetyltransferase n=1 Tax=Corynebacterium flavescens TaxID=28028 RepID=UPI003FD25CE8
MNLRELVTADAASCAELEKLLFPGETPWSKYVFQVEISQHFNFYFGVEEEGLLLGYAGLALLGPATDPEYEIHTIGVAPQAQRRGIGAMMMDNIVHIADSQDAPVFLEVRVGNTAALALYERYGFIKQGIRRNYYQPSGADAHTMVRMRKSQR